MNESSAISAEPPHSCRTAIPSSFFTAPCAYPSESGKTCAPPPVEAVLVDGITFTADAVRRLPLGLETLRPLRQEGMSCA